ncbi:MAG: Low molecular weight protein-tyrosine-phosphatase YwlE [Firmicutes bacterium ADurb.Bin182]|nr:MAG: Low molecular weight protein-tyrosine-phosphatase YwlE [Firmicutes bacterium ADurb.Bin182]
MKTILFVCTGNVCRSPMAEALMDDLSDDYPSIKGRVCAASAGTMACEDARISAHAEEALSRLGIDFSRHRSRQLTSEIAKEADLILTMEAHHLDELEAICPEAYEKAHTLKGYAMGVEGFPGDCEYDIQDPFRKPLEVYIEAAEQIKACIIKLLERLEKSLQN